MRTVVFCVTLLATAIPVMAQERPTGWFDLPVSGGARTLAAAGILPEDRAQAITVLTRTLYGQDPSTGVTTAVLRERLGGLVSPLGGEDSPTSIPVPLDRNAWERLLLLEPNSDLSKRLLTDRAAMLVAYGLTQADASIRALALRNGDFLRRIYHIAPGAFAIVARSLRIEQGRVVVPGGDRAGDIWEKLAGESPSRPEAFVPALIAKDSGRLAWYFDTLSSLDAAHLRAAWPHQPYAARLDNARALYESFRSIDPRSRLEDHPFKRSPADPWMVLTSVDLDGGGVVVGPNAQWLWQTLFDRDALERDDLTWVPRVDRRPVSVTWLARAIAAQPLRERRDRFEMFRLAQRAFPLPTYEDTNDLLLTLSGYKRHKGVLLGLERMGVREPSTWAVVIEAARQVDHADGDRGDALTAFQAAFAIVGRMRQVGSVDETGASRLLRALAEAVGADHRVPRAVAKWIREALLVTPKTSYDQAIIDALAGPAPRNTRSIEWEGLRYELSYPTAERDRLMRLRVVTAVPSLDAALASADASALAPALKGLIYAVALGDPEGPVTLGRDIAGRHDFGLRSSAPVEEIWAWATPIELQGTGQPWHVQGSLIGLDLALSRLAVRRISDDEMPNAPTITTNDFGTLTRTVVVMVPDDFLDIDRDAIVAAIARGRQRVADAGADLTALGLLAREANLSPAVRELLPWVLAHEPDTIRDLFSLRDLLWLGKPDLPRDRLDRWGVLAQASDARLTAAMPDARPWDDFAGRADMGQMATQVPDLALRLAEETARLHLPATLVPALLAYAVQDFWYAVRARFSDDWPEMVRAAAAIRPERVEDYVAALAGTGPLRLPSPQR